jgi:hypothetical protein
MQEMNYKLFHRATAAAVFMIAAVQFFLTLQPSVSFWDPGELSAAAYALEIPHPPGGPLFSLVGHFLYMLPIPGNIGIRMNTLSALASACSVLLLYLVAVSLIRIYKGRNPENTIDAVGTYGAAAIGALAYSFCDTIWFNGVESNYFAASALLYSLVVWLVLMWYEHWDQPVGWRYLLMGAYLVGLSPGVHLMSVLAVFTVVLLVVSRRYIEDEAHFKKTAYILLGQVVILFVIALAMWSSQSGSQPPAPEDVKNYDTNFIIIMGLASAAYMGVFWRKIFNKNSYYLPVAVAAVALAVVYPGIIKKLPMLLLLVAGDNSAGGVTVLLLFLGLMVYLAYWAMKKKKTIYAVAAISVVLMVIGFTTYTMTIIRANQHPAMNENKPNSFSRLVSYLNREQYGDFPIFKRRFSNEPQHQSTWANYSTDLDFFVNYQMNRMYGRYVGWNFIGRSSFAQNAPIDWRQLFGIPFAIGLAGLYFHFRKDWRMASAFLILFIFMGYFTAFYQNQQEWQPRERDYFYAGSYFVFAVWIALGIRGLIDLVRETIRSQQNATRLTIGILCVGAFLVPVRMFQTNFFTHDRSKNWLPWIYAYDLLQSCKPNSILFTNGDNDTFPLWYLQDVEGVRRDIRIVNLSLVNTEWYIKQLKHEAPYGTPAVNISLSDDVIDRLQLMKWETRKISLPVSQAALRDYGVTDSTVINAGAISFTMQPTLHYGDIGAIRTQDILVREIVLQNAWKRPIYFANTCGEDTKIGLGEYLQTEGFASQLVPQKKRPGGSGVYYYVNEPLMRKNLLEDIPGINKSYQPGFLFRGLNDKSIFYDENSEHMAQGFRGAFIMLGTYYLNGVNDKQMCIKTLDRMETLVPPTVINMDYRQRYELASIYYSAGDTTRFRDIAKEIEAIALSKVNEQAVNASENNDQYAILIDLYDKTGEYAKAAELLERLVPSYPTDQALKKEIERYRALAGQQMKAQKTR